MRGVPRIRGRRGKGKAVSPRENLRVLWGFHSTQPDGNRREGLRESVVGIEGVLAGKAVGRDVVLREGKEKRVRAMVGLL